MARRSLTLLLFVFFLGLLRPCAADWAQSGSITASGAVVPISNPNASTLSIQVTGTFSGTLQFEGTVDQSNWFSLSAVPVGSGAVVSSTTTTGAWIAGYASLKQARVRASSFASGTAVISLNLSPGVSPTSIGGAVSLGSSAALADATANPTLSAVQVYPMVYNGTTWDRARDMNSANAAGGNFAGIPAFGPMYLDVGTSTTRRAVTAASTTSGISGIQSPASASLVWDTSVFRPQAGDSSGRTLIGAGTQAIGNVGGLTKTVDATLTRPGNTTTYTANDEMTDTGGAILTLTGAATATGGKGIITQCLLSCSSNGTTKPTFTVYLYDTTSTPQTDNAAFAPSDSVQDTCVGYFTLSTTEVGDATSNTGNFTMDSGQIHIPFTTSGSANLFCRIKVTNGYTPGANSDTYKLRFKIQQDAN